MIVWFHMEQKQHSDWLDIEKVLKEKESEEMMKRVTLEYSP